MIIYFLSGLEIEEQVIYIVTEYITPLEDVLKSCSLDIGFDQSIIWGCFQIIVNHFIMIDNIIEWIKISS